MAVKKENIRRIADELSSHAEEYATVSVYIDPETLEEIIEGYDESDRYQPLIDWITYKRGLGHEPTTDDILHWAATA